MSTQQSDGLTQTIAVKLEDAMQCLSLSVDSTTYLRWKMMIDKLGLSSDGDLASFLLQHYDEMSNLQLAQCVKCNGPIVQYCVPCNIYMTRPSTLPQPLTILLQKAQESATDLGNVEIGQALSSQDGVAVMKADGRTDNSGPKQRREIRPAPTTNTSGRGDDQDTGKGHQGSRESESEQKRLEPKVIKLFMPKPGGAAARSLLTPNVLRDLRAAQQTCCGEKAVTTSATITRGGEGDHAEQNLEEKVFTTSATITRGEGDHAEQNLEEKVFTTSATITRGEGDHAEQNLEEKVFTTSATITRGEGDHAEQNLEEKVFTTSATITRDCAQPLESTDSQASAPASSQNTQAGSSVRSGPQPPHRDPASETVDPSFPAGISLKETPQQPSENVPEEEDNVDRWKKEDDDSDYHCKPLFPAHHHHGDQTSHTSTSSGQEEGWASTHRVQTHTPTELRTRSSPRKRQRSLSSTSKETDSSTLKTRTSPRKRLRSGSKENSGTGGSKTQSSRKRSRLEDQVLSRSEGQVVSRSEGQLVSRLEGQVVSRPEGQVVSRAEGRVIIVTDKEVDSPPSRLCSPTAQRDRGSGGPVGSRRSQRVAASKASRPQIPVKVEVVDHDSEKVADNNDQAIDVSDQVSGVDNQDSDIGDDDSDTSDGINDETSEACSSAFSDVDDEITDSTPRADDADIIKISDSPKQADDDDDTSKASSSVQDKNAIIAKKQMEAHEQKRKKPVLCTFCDEKFQTGAEKIAHVKEKHGERPYKCTLCDDKSYRKLSNLKVHVNKRHEKVKANFCPHCCRGFIRAHDLKQHMQEHCQDTGTVCEVCGKKLKTAKLRKSHMRTHVPSDKPFVCQVCGRAFRWKGSFKDHLRIHTNEKPFVCKVCGECYVQSGSLTRHMERRHTPNRPRPFICDICGEARYSRDQFQKHIMIHTGEKPYVCDVCGASFIQITALKGHSRIHKEEAGRPHKCPVCGAAFKIAAGLTRHMNRIHKANTVKLPQQILPAKQGLPAKKGLPAMQGLPAMPVVVVSGDRYEIRYPEEV